LRVDLAVTTRPLDDLEPRRGLAPWRRDQASSPGVTSTTATSPLIAASAKRRPSADQPRHTTSESSTGRADRVVRQLRRPDPHRPGGIAGGDQPVDAHRQRRDRRLVANPTIGFVARLAHPVQPPPRQLVVRSGDDHIAGRGHPDVAHRIGIPVEFDPAFGPTQVEHVQGPGEIARHQPLPHRSERQRRHSFEFDTQVGAAERGVDERHTGRRSHRPERTCDVHERVTLSKTGRDDIGSGPCVRVVEHRQCIETGNHGLAAGGVDGPGTLDELGVDVAGAGKHDAGDRVDDGDVSLAEPGGVHRVG
jgi:hypothetical protein